MTKAMNRTYGEFSFSVILIGWIFGMAVTMAEAALLAVMISTERIPAESMGYCALGILLTASIVTSAAAGRRGEKRLCNALAASTLYLATLLSVTALFFGGQYYGVGVTMFVIFSGCILGVLPRQKRRKGSKLWRNKTVRR